MFSALVYIVSGLVALVYQSNGLTFRARQDHHADDLRSRLESALPKKNISAPRPSPASRNLTSLLHIDTPRVDAVLTRPSAGKGVDTVRFGLIAKNFFGTELKLNRFTIDLVLSIRWQDPRAVKMIPQGLDKLTLAWSQAVELVWMPGIVVANRDIEMYEIISASVTIFRSGEVLRVERALARCMKKFALEEYPFDMQYLDVDVVSSKYMLDEVVLQPSENASAVEEQIWGLYYLVGWGVKGYEDHNGDLRKSRGMLQIKVDRSLAKYFDDHLIPSFIVLVISWAVFYFPFANPFITPRLALSILALLTFTNLMLKSSKELPGPAPFNWNDLFNQQIQALMFFTIIVNICSEIVFHQLKMEPMARTMNHEGKVVLPVAGIVNIIIILSAGKYKWISIYWATIVTKSFCVFLLITYGAHVFRQYGKRKEEASRESSFVT